jgi:hypothetical protein
MKTDGWIDMTPLNFSKQALSICWFFSKQSPIGIEFSLSRDNENTPSCQVYYLQCGQQETRPKGQKNQTRNIFPTQLTS